MPCDSLRQRTRPIKPAVPCRSRPEWKTLGVPDSSFRYCWQQYRRRCQSSRLPRTLVEFCESPAGLAFLQQQLIALHLVFVQANDCGLRNLTLFLQRSGLDEVLASSYGAQQAFAARLETLLAEYGREEEQRLAAQMPPRQITACEDETFYLLLEQYAPQRDAETWNRCLDERLVGWSITVCQATSDEAKALIAHAEEHLGAHHSPDLFHVQQETVKATSLALAGQTRRAQEAFVAAEHDMQTRGRRISPPVSSSVRRARTWPSCSSRWRRPPPRHLPRLPPDRYRHRPTGDRRRSRPSADRGLRLARRSGRGQRSGRQSSRRGCAPTCFRASTWSVRRRRRARPTNANACELWRRRCSLERARRMACGAR